MRVAAPPSVYRSTFSGTSGSAPHVTGAMALLWSAAPQLIGQVVASEDLLKRTAKPLTSSQDCGGFPGSAVPNAVFGWGRLDIAAAVDAAAPPARPREILAPRHRGTHRLSPRP